MRKLMMREKQDNPDLPKEANKAKCIAAAFCVVSCFSLIINFLIPLWGLFAALMGLLACIGSGLLVCCCAPKHQDAGACKFTAAAVLLLIAGIGQLIGCIVNILVLVWLADENNMWSGDSWTRSWNGDWSGDNNGDNNGDWSWNGDCDNKESEDYHECDRNSVGNSCSDSKCFDYDRPNFPGAPRVGNEEYYKCGDDEDPLKVAAWVFCVLALLVSLFAALLNIYGGICACKARGPMMAKAIAPPMPAATPVATPVDIVPTDPVATPVQADSVATPVHPSVAPVAAFDMPKV